MTRDETKQLLMAIFATYPNFKVQDKTIALNTWTMLLEEYDFKSIQLAFKTYATTDTKGFAPSPGQLIDLLYIKNKSEELSEGEAWGLVSKAIMKGNYSSKEEFEKLPPVIQKAVGSASQIREWAQADLDSLQVISSNFRRTYRAECQRQRELEKMPIEIKNLIGSGTNKLLKGE